MAGKVLVLGDGNKSFLSVIRSLGRKGLEVHVGWYSTGYKKDTALNSRYIAKRHNLIPYSPNSQKWKKQLIQVINKEKFDLVIPCNDHVLIPLQKNKDLNEYVRCYVLSDEAFAITTSKEKTLEMARQLGVPCPKSQTFYNYSSKQLLTEFNLPLVIKPLSSYDASNPLCRRDVHKAYTK